MTRVGLWLPPFAYMALIFYFSSQSDPVPVITAHVWDKALHALEYAGLAALVGRALLGEGLGSLATFLAAVLLTGAYGASDEYHQMFVPLRSADLRDWIADLLGASLGAVACLLRALRWQRRSS
jgi:VanZ family protein